MTGAQATYENGARVNTSFVTNLDRFEMRGAPALRTAVEEAQADGAPTMPKYDYPAEVVTAPMLARYSKYGIDFAVESRECEFIRALDMQREMGKGIYGSGYLIGGDVLARRAEADRRVTPWAEHVTFELSGRERGIVGRLG